MKVHHSTNPKGENKIKVEFTQRELDELENVETCIEQIENEIDNITFKNKESNNETAEKVRAQIPPPVTTIQQAEYVDTYDDVLVALNEFSDFFERLKLGIDYGELSSEALLKQLEERDIAKAIRTYDKHRLIKDEYK